MNRVLWSCAALFALFVTVEALTCNSCDVKILGTCLGDKPVVCTGNQDRCYSAVARFSADLLPIYARGCINAASCENKNGTILSVSYTITTNCCNTSLCNGAASIQLPMTAGLGVTLLAVWSQWS